MAFRDPNWVQGSAGYTAEEDRQVLAALLCNRNFTSFTPAVGSVNAGGGHGVIGDGDYLVTANGTPNDTVHVAAGQAAVKGSTQTDQGSYIAGNDADAVVTVPTADTANPRNDLIVVRVRDNEYDAGGQNKADVELVQGTPAGSPVDPAVPASTLVVARIRVPAVPSGPTVITGSLIDDLRTWAYAIGAVALARSTTRPNPVVRKGQLVYESDTGNLLVYSGTEWTAPKNLAWGKVASQKFTSDGSALGSPATSDFTRTFTTRADRLYGVNLHTRVAFSALSAWHVNFVTSDAETIMADEFSVGGASELHISATVPWEPSAGSKTIDVRVSRQSGSGTIQFLANSGTARWFWIEDIGPR